MRRRLPFVLKTIVLVFTVSFSATAQVKRSNEDLIKLVDKHLGSPITKNVYGNGDVFLQRNMWNCNLKVETFFMPLTIR